MKNDELELIRALPEQVEDGIAFFDLEGLPPAIAETYFKANPSGQVPVINGRKMVYAHDWRRWREQIL